MWPVPLVTLVVLVVLVRAAAGSCPRECSMCGSVGTGLAELQCAGRVYRVRDDGYAEADCQGLPLDCSAIPPLPTPAPLHRLELTNCSLPPGAAACLLRALRSPPPEVLMTMALVERVGEGAFEGLEGVQDVIMMSAASQSSMPPLSPLAPLHLRVVEGTNLTLPSSPLPPSLVSLEVSNSGVRSLPPAAFLGLNDLETLRVWGNELEEVPEAVLEALPSLRTLSLSRNPLKRLRVGRARRLASLAAHRVSVDLLQEGDVSGLTDLKELTVESTVPLSLAPGALSALPTLAALAVTYSGVGALPPALLEGSRALVNVSFKGNRIREIDEDLFRNQSRLQRLDLSRNRLEALPGRLLRDLPALRDLRLDHNRLAALADRVFSSLPQLTSLSLSHNRLASISGQAFQSSALRSLDLSHNLLPFSPPPLPAWGDQGGEYFDLGAQSPFSTLLELEVLDLSYNNISYIFSDWRYVLLRRLRRLDLSHNAFTEINSGDLQFVQTDLTVDLSYNDISSLLPPPPYLDPPTPRSATLLLDHNPYNCDCNLYPLIQAMSSLPNYRLEEARCALPPRLERTPLPALDADSLTCPLPDLPRASCLIRPHRNRLECTAGDVGALPDPQEYGLPDLALRLNTSLDLAELPAYVTDLNMSRLGLKNIENIPKTVKVIDLSYNELSSLPPHLLEGNHTLLLRGNSLSCDCWHSESVTGLQRHRGRVADFRWVECARGGAVGAVDAGALCGGQRAAAAGAGLAALALALAVAAALGWRRARRRLGLSALPGLGWLGGGERAGEEADKPYDVFVSFSHEDFPWVRDRLMPVLDAQYAVCVHYREWEVGQAIPVQIQRSVERSRRTLVVLSASFARSAWAVEEFRAACAASARDRTPRALVLLLGQVDLAALHPDLRDYLSLTTYLEAHDPYFWEKLKRALPRRPKERPADPDPAPAPTGPERPSILTAIKNMFKRPTVMDLPDPVKVTSDPAKVTSDPSSLDVILDRNGQLVNRAYVKDV